MTNPERNLNAAVLMVAADTERAMSTLRGLLADERAVFLSTLKRLKVTRWAVLVHRLSTDPAYSAEVTPHDAAIAADLVRQAIAEAA